ncbi:beta-lactamase [Thermodesulfobacterium geofontis OPF15]|jgi:CubicO group peptidase (beta-lactamase class C family)|uniref:Beta-lactamase n=1 Tax=Thermodesulfobacterium geofontis (strain OPF15) TaxID=795359 RepID=F8C4Q4_THEGP|nr:serine hydrolase [Thermodesulfobacterium geofontis]AEH22725.1 beta-lactamase [Thermodesulfobacterium geofontis OPF15]
MAFYKVYSHLFSLLEEGIKNEVFPGAIAGISISGSRYIVGRGYKSLFPFLEPLEDEDLFDLASLTKPLALAYTFIYLLSKNPKIELFKPIGEYIELNSSLARIPIFRFLNHTSGLPPWYPLYKEVKEPKENNLEIYIQKINDLPLEYKPGEKCVYSDLGYYLLTYLLEKVYEKSFSNLFEEAKNIIPFSKKAFLDFNPLEKGFSQEKIVPTSVCPINKKILRGVVEDENTRALKGVSGVAGLFGNIYEVLDILETILRAYKGEVKELSYDLVKEFLDFREKDFSFSLGFMLQSYNGYSATGGVFSDKTVGHLGFTGCSFFIDLEKDFIVVLLTNRVYFGRTNQKIKDFRVKFHTLLSSLALK